MLQNSTFNSCLPTNIRFGLDIVKNELLQEIRQANKKRVFIATDKGVEKTGLVASITSNLTTGKIDATVFSDVESNPQAETIMKGANLYKENQCDMIVAIGGGSSIDFAKAVGVVVTHSGHILDYKRGGKSEITNSIPLLFAIPTTVGTGSEVTAVSIVTDKSAERKYGVASPYLIPKTAFIDPLLTSTLPKPQISSTAADALVHAIEAYTSLRSTPIADGLALQAIRMIEEFLPASYAQPDNLEARSQIHLASTLAGLSFSLAGLGLVHSCSHPMSAVYNVPHGIANAILLPYVTEYNLISNYKKYADISRIFKLELMLKDDKISANELPHLLRAFLDCVDIPKDFSSLKIHATDLDIERLAADAMNDLGTIYNNPRKASKEDIVKIYKKVL